MGLKIDFLVSRESQIVKSRIWQLQQKPIRRGIPPGRRDDIALPIKVFDSYKRLYCYDGRTLADC